MEGKGKGGSSKESRIQPNSNEIAKSVALNFGIERVYLVWGFQNCQLEAIDLLYCLCHSEGMLLFFFKLIFIMK